MTGGENDQVAQEGKDQPRQTPDGSRSGDAERTTSLLYRWGAIIERWRWPFLLAPVLLALLCLPLAGQVTDRLSAGGWLPRDAESTIVDNQLNTTFGRRTTSHFLLFRDPAGKLSATDPRFRREVERLVAPLRANPHVASVYTWGTTSSDVINPMLLSDDRSMSMAVVMLNQDVREASESVGSLVESLRSDLLDVEIGGWPATTLAIRDLTTSDLHRGEMISLPLTLLLLVVVFGGVLAAGLPIAIAVVSLIVTFAAIAMMSRLLETSIFTVNVVSMIGLAIGIDYALILITRYREELAGEDPGNALAIALSTAGKAIVISGATVAIGLAGLLAFEVPAATSTGLAGAVVVIASVTASLTVLPAALSLWGHRLARSNGVRTPQATRLRTVLRPWFRTVTRVTNAHPALVMAASTGVLLAFAAPILDLQPAAPTMDILPRDEPSRQVFETVEQSFSSATLSPVVLIVEPERGRMTGSRNLDELLAFAEALEELEHVQSAVSVWTFLSQNPGSTVVSGGLLLDDDLRRLATPYLTGDAAVIELTVRTNGNDGRQQAVIQEVRQRARELSDGRFFVRVGGETATSMDLVTHVRERAPWSVAFVMVATWLVLFLQFRSFLLPIKAIVLNLLSLTASFGALVWIFQEGHLANLLDFEPMGYTVIIIPILMFCFMFGLSMDYEVIMLSRIREAWLATGDNSAAVRYGLHASAPIVSSAALIMLVVFSVFGASELQIIKSVGVGLALAVLLDATLIRLLLLPAAMQLMGRWNWWAPSFKTRREPVVSVVGTGDEQVVR